MTNRNDFVSRDGKVKITFCNIEPDRKLNSNAKFAISVKFNQGEADERRVVIHIRDQHGAFEPDVFGRVMGDPAGDQVFSGNIDPFELHGKEDESQ